MRNHYYLFVLLLPILLSGCEKESAVSNTLVESEWKLVSLVSSLDTRLLPEEEVTLHFTKDGLSGNSGCNWYSSSDCLIYDGMINISRIFSTYIYCGEEHIEELYYKALGEVSAYVHTGLTLTLVGDDVTLNYVRKLK